MNKLIVSLLLGHAATAMAYFVPNSSNFICPTDSVIDASKPIRVAVSDPPEMIGNCWWEKPTTSYLISDDGQSVRGLATWVLNGPYFATGCEEVKKAEQTVSGLIVKVSCIKK